MESKTNLTVTITGVSEGPDGMMHVINESYDNVTGLVFHGFRKNVKTDKTEAHALCVGGISLSKIVNILGAMKCHFGKERFRIASMIAAMGGEGDDWEVAHEIRQKEE